jgi:hydroxymethylpyrimidine/phosphomethylpyrimidine kinase
MVWDTVLKSSTTFDFFIGPRNIKSILIQIDLITPNYTEIAQLSNEIPPEE